MPRTPLGTYRLQLHAGFDFNAAASVTDYLADLGISHLYASPYLQAQPGSTHGYDVVAHREINAELGGDEARQRMVARLKELGMGQILDIVPNHMAVAPQNVIWADVLENGPSSRYSSFFDIDWNSSEERLRAKVMLPVLGDQYGRVLERGELRLIREGSSFRIVYYDKIFPVAPRSLWQILSRAADIAESDLLRFLADSYHRLPAPFETDRKIQLARHRDKTVLAGLLERLCREDEATCSAIDKAVEEWNADIDKLDELLNAQNYRLAYWRTSDQDLGYRRFFDVNNLVGVRQEREHVFEETHQLILQWLKEGVLDGVRVDHPDGLRDPKQYLERLRSRAPEAWIVGEKILEPGEWLRPEWPIQGTTGYDFMNVCNHLLVYPEGLDALQEIYAAFTRQPTDFSEIVFEKKQKITKETLASDVNRLTSLFVEICEFNRDSRDYTRAEIRRAIRSVASCFHVYRTYVVPSRDEITDEDRYNISQAIEEAKQRKPEIDPGLFEFLGEVLELKVRGTKESEFCMRFQQFTGPVMAKAVEDTAFYCYNRLTSLNEVGGDPARRGVSLEEFHAYQAKMQATHPATMLALSTHDTKRAEDVRARIAVLSEIPDRFRLSLRRWERMLHPFTTEKYPDTGTLYFFFQSLIGAWPIDKDRLTAYMIKAMREAKLETSWVQNNTEYEQTLATFIEQALQHQPFVDDVEVFVNRINRAGRVNSLAQTLIKYTAPGVPDLYQGCELWDHSMVDPDNRRPVDYDKRRWMLGELKAMDYKQFLEELPRRFEEGAPKMWTIWKSLTLRREHPEWFGPEAAYTPLEAQGPKANHVVAYLRGENVLTVVPRFYYTLNGSWAGTVLNLPPGRWRNQLTGTIENGGRNRMANLLEDFPVALLVKEGAR